MTFNGVFSILSVIAVANAPIHVFLELFYQYYYVHDSFQFSDCFLGPLAESQRAFVMALCPTCVRPFVHPSVNSSFKTSPQKLLTGFIRNFIGMFLRWSSFKFLQIIVFYEEFWLPWQSK